MPHRDEVPRDRRLRVTEVYASVQGESTHVGKPMVFIRLTGCPLRCTWCDSTFTFQGGTWRDVDDVVAEVLRFGLPAVEVTGGEPLMQPNAVGLMQKLLDAGLEVLLETSGALAIDGVPPGVRVILDLKAPGSAMEDRNRWENLDVLDRDGEVKFVLADRTDYEWAREVIRQRGLAARWPVHFSPVWGVLSPATLVEWMVTDRVAARLMLQVHKVIWDPAARGV